MRRLEENGYIYKQIVHQAYCPKCRRFLPDRYVEGTCPYCGKQARGDECDQGCGKHLEPGEIQDPFCKVCGTKAEFRDQEHFFFRLSAFRDYLLPFLDRSQGSVMQKIMLSVESGMNCTTGVLPEHLTGA